jgi:drug/metabolite transporter (DMT)-like permease
MTQAKVFLYTLAAMLAFAGNSLLCRMALRGEHIDASSFTLIRLASGAMVLFALLRRRGDSLHDNGSWGSALALFVYATGFSWAYITLPAGAGALLLFGAVQASMLGYGLYKGERLHAVQWLGLLLACAGLLVLLLPGASAPPFEGALMMVLAGVAWGAYSLRGRGVANATASTAGNFVRAVPFAVGMSVLGLTSVQFDLQGLAYAVCSGALTSGFGYAIWYSVLPYLRATTAAIVQLSVPVIAAFGAVVLLNEALSPRLGLASVAVIGGIGLVLYWRGRIT